MLRALGHPTRLRLLDRLEAGPVSPVDCVRVGGESLGTISHHFRALRKAGLIEVAAQEQRRGALKTTYRLSRLGQRVMAWLKQG